MESTCLTMTARHLIKICGWLVHETAELPGVAKSATLLKTGPAILYQSYCIAFLSLTVFWRKSDIPVIIQLLQF